MKYKKTTLNQLAVIMVIGSVLFFIALYLLTGSGPWDIYAYLSVIVLIVLLFALDIIAQLMRYLSKE